MKKMFLYCLLIIAVALCQCRKYDVEEQARTLYGESLKSVVERFRRTPEYLAILNDEVTELYKRLGAVSDRLCYVFALKLQDRVPEETGGDRSQRINPHHYRRPGSEWRTPKRRNPHEVKWKSPVNLLDSYAKFRDPLSVDERNRMRELGFEYFGKAVHAMLESMVPDDHLPISTLLPGGGDKQPTTYHQHHEVTKSSTEPVDTYPTHHNHSSTRRLD